MVVGHAAEVAAAWRVESGDGTSDGGGARILLECTSLHRLGMESRVRGLEILGRFGGVWVDFGEITM